MHSRISNTSKTSQNSSLPTTASILQPRDFGIDTPQPETLTEERDLDAEYEYAKKMSRCRADIPTFPPETPPNIQAKLSVGKPNDKYEQEADNVAIKVVNEINTPSFTENPIHAYPLIQTPYINTPREYNRPKLQRVENPALLPQENRYHVGLHPHTIENYLRRKQAEQQQSKISTNNQDLENTIQSKKGSGQEIAPNVREPMEQAFGADFSGVRVHTDGESDQLNESLNAKAFATGKDVFFRQGAYNPTSRDGQHLLAHELTHVVQQNGNTLQPKSLTKIARKENKIESKIAENSQEQKEEDNESQVEKSTLQTSSSLDDNTDKTSQTVTAKSDKASYENVATAKESNETAENADTPADEQGKASSTTKSSKKLAATEATDTTDNSNNSPTTSINESANTAIASNRAKAPASAEQDPEFQAVVGKSKTLAGQHKQHDPAQSKSQQAQAAAQPPSNEVESKAQSNHVDDMGEAETPAFDAAAFKAKLMERIADMAPKSLQEADEFKNNNKIDSMKGELSGQVKEEQKKSQGTLEEKTQEPPNTNGIEAKQVTPLPPPEPGTPPSNIGADKAAPKPKTQSEVEAPLQQDSKKLDQQMADAKVTDEQLANSNEPEFQSALASKKQAQTSAAQAGPQYRQQEQNLITTAKTTAEATAQQHLQQMQTVKTQNITQVSSEQVATKGKDEEARTKIAGDINKIYETTKTKVEQTLSGLDSKVQQAFDTGAANAKKAFEDYVDKKMKAYKDERYSGFWGPGKWLVDKLLGMPSEVNAFYQEGRQLYINQMDGVINHVVGIVSEGLTQAKAEIANGKQEIQQYVQKLPQELQAVGQEAATDIQGKFDELQQSIDDKQGELIDSLAQKYQENLQAVDAKIEEMKAANKGLIDKALDAVVGVIKTIIELTKMLIQVLARAAAAVGNIIKNPIQFLGNLIAAVKQGFLNFVKNIGKHLQTGLIAWLTGTMDGAGITIPENFDLQGVFSLVTQILGLSYDFIRSQAVNRLGEEKVSYLEKGEETFKILATEGLPGIWHLLQDKVGDIKTMVMDGITDFVTNTIVQAGIEFVLSMLTPASAFVKACKMIIDVVKFFIERAQQIADLINAIIDSVTAIASGATEQATQAIENALAKSLPVALGFLASLLGLGGITQKIQAIIQKVRQPVVKAVNWVIDKGAKVANKVGGKFKNSKVGNKVVKAKKAAEKKYQAGKKYIEDKKAAGQKYFDEKKQAVHQSIEKRKNKFANTKAGKALTRVNDAANKKLDALEKKRQAFNNKIEKVKEWPGKQLEKVENKAAEWRAKAKDKLVNSKLGKNVSQKWDKAKDWGSKNKDAFKDKVDKLEGKVQDKLGLGKDKEKAKEDQNSKENTSPDKRSDDVKKNDLASAEKTLKEIISKSESTKEVERHFPAIKKEFGLKKLEWDKLGTPSASIVMEINPKATIDLTGTPLLLNQGDTSHSNKFTQEVIFKEGKINGHTVGNVMEAKKLGPNHPQGGSPGGSNLKQIMQHLQTDPKLSNENKYIKGHLLNDNLGGPGEDINLYPITANANKVHENEVESQVKDWVNNDGYWVYYKVEVKENKVDLLNGEINADLICEANKLDADGNRAKSGAFKTIIHSEYKANQISTRDKDVYFDSEAKSPTQDPNFKKDQVEWSSTRTGTPIQNLPGDISLLISTNKQALDKIVPTARRSLRRSSVPDRSAHFYYKSSLSVEGELKNNLLTIPGYSFEEYYQSEDKKLEEAKSVWNGQITKINKDKDGIINKLKTALQKTNDKLSSRRYKPY
ncbi:DUF4157 domain-containing protein [Anabaena sp. FACHB-1237]|uniref:eCIS core domain-containing protein n=1 Tax=Anabaena sp. FACHB-1237 TaxID=2692769 RepID=UPI001680B75F|nr:DUF4157 domain-containing protein [Anabaena sp. FACHB-1237]MBD2136528.1 DUF4157 domain-containing protein [Anabaena sp. FACHB-1237]